MPEKVNYFVIFQDSPLLNIAGKNEGKPERNGRYKIKLGLLLQIKGKVEFSPNVLEMN